MRLLYNAELLNGEIFTTLRVVQVLIENWRRDYDVVRPHSSLGYQPHLLCPTLRFGQIRRWPIAAGF